MPHLRGEPHSWWEVRILLWKCHNCIKESPFTTTREQSFNAKEKNHQKSLKSKLT